MSEQGTGSPPLIVTAEYFERLLSGEGFTGPTGPLAEALKWPLKFGPDGSASIPAEWLDIFGITDPGQNRDDHEPASRETAPDLH